MELKGEAAKKLSKEDRDKKEKTLKKMEESRKKKDILLRDKIDKKVEWLNDNESNAIIQIEDLQKSLDLIKQKLERIRGAKIVLQELIK